MNKVILIGRLTKDVELRYTQTNNTAVASFSLAVNRKFVKPGEERQADFFNIIAWNKLAENISKYYDSIPNLKNLSNPEVFYNYYFSYVQIMDYGATFL